MLTSDYEELLKKSRDEIVHIVPASNVMCGSKIAYCGFDCEGRDFKTRGSANCVVCIAIRDNRDWEWGP